MDPRARHGEFWELHRRLGECYAAVAAGPTSALRSPVATIGRSSWNDPGPPDGSPVCLVDMMQRRQSSGKMEEKDGISSKEKVRLSHRPSSSLMSDHCKELELHHCWAERAKSKNRRGSVSMIEAYSSRPSRKAFHFTLSPNGHFRNAWDLLGICLLALDTFLIPLQFVQPELYQLYPSLSTAAAAAIIYWCLDSCLAFFTGYLDKGNLIQDRRQIACHYLRTWCVPDLVVNSIDIVLVLLEDDSLRASTKGLRLLRLFRVVRLGKVTRFASWLRDQFESEVAYTQFTVLVLVLGMMLLEHIVACCWFGISPPGSGGWLDMFELQDKSFMEQYTSSLRWAYSQLGYGGTNIEAVNTREGIYSSCVSMVSLIMSSTIISSMTSLVSSIQSQRMEATKQFSMVRRFIRANQIPASLGDRVTRFLHYTYHDRIAMPNDPQILALLSKSLQAELQLARHAKHLEKMPFLAQVLQNPTISSQEGDAMRRLATTGLSYHEVGEDDVIFIHDNEATMAFLQIQGSLIYSQFETSTAPEENAWISEMCLWMQWDFVGDLRCLTFSKIYTMHAETFCDIVTSVVALQVQAHLYATEYVKALRAQAILSDLWQHREAADAAPGFRVAGSSPLKWLKMPFKRIVPV